MAKTIKELKDQFNSHITMENPHNVTFKQIWGLDKLNNTSDVDKPMTNTLEEEMAKKINISDIYNAVTEDTTKDLTKLPWSAAQGYSMKNVIDTYQAQDTSAIEARIAWCENNV